MPKPVLTNPTDLPDQIFFGRFGLRAGWSIAVFFIFVALISGLAGLFAVGVTGHSAELAAARVEAKAHPAAPKPKLNLPFTPSLVLAQDSVVFAGLLAVCFVFSRTESRQFSAYGLGASRFADVIPGALWGIVSMSMLVAVLRWRGLLIFDSRALHGFSIISRGIAWLLAFLLVGFAEEYEFRGYLQFTLTRGLWRLAERLRPSSPQPVAFWIAAVLMSLTFGALHSFNGGENAVGLLQVVFIGLAFSYALWRTGSLWWGIGFHALWDFMQSFTFGVADSGSTSVGRLFVTHPAGRPLFSGGSDGPEGSLYAVIFVMLTFVAIRVTTRGGAYAWPDQRPLLDDSSTASPIVIA